MFLFCLLVLGFAETPSHISKDIKETWKLTLQLGHGGLPAVGRLRIPPGVPAMRQSGVGPRPTVGISRRWIIIHVSSFSGAQTHRRYNRMEPRDVPPLIANGITARTL